jgi:hypothetical protein
MAASAHFGSTIGVQRLLVDGLNRLDTGLRGKETKVSETALAVTCPERAIA